MKNFDEMTERDGFQSGASVPAEARAARSVYIQAINGLAEKYGSQYRAIAFNHVTHNGCMVIFMWAEDLAGAPEEQILNGVPWETVVNFKDVSFYETDEAMQRAVQNADELYDGSLDQLIIARVEVDTAELLRLKARIEALTEGLPEEGELQA